MQTTPISTQTGRRRAPILIAVGALISAVAVAGCTSPGGDDSGGSTSGGGNGSAARAAAPDASPDFALQDGVAAAGSATSPGGQSSESGRQPIVTGPALVKTAAVDLKSDRIQSIVDKVYALALTSGGRVDSEQTSTNADGAVDHSRIQLRVPVAKFDEAVSRIYNLSPDHQKETSTEDVTAHLADVASRVASARASIAQLRRLFDQATALGQVIRLERELSSREADLESLQAQQRSLSAEAAMSTIQVTVTLPPQTAPPSGPSDSDQAGFLSGIEKGWDALVTFVVGGSHLLGLVLPLGALAALFSGVGWVVFRRFSGRGPGAPQPSE
jgi:Domain of unknown function (DUF4349)